MASKSESIFVGSSLKHITHILPQSEALSGTSSRQHLVATAEWSPDTQAKTLFDQPSSLLVFAIGILICMHI